MAAETLSLEPCSRELNGLGQLVAWFAIRKGLYHRERHAQWISTLNGTEYITVDKSGFYYSRPFCMCIKKTERFFIDTVINSQVFAAFFLEVCRWTQLRYLPLSLY